jgi:hypothetical protein
VGEAKVFCKKHNAILVEDAAHCLLPTDRIGRKGDIVLYSPHKLLAVPHAAICVARPSLKKKFSKTVDVQDELSLAIDSLGLQRASVFSWLLKRITQIVFRKLLNRRSTAAPFWGVDASSVAAPSATPLVSRYAQSVLWLEEKYLSRVAEQRRQSFQFWQTSLGDGEFEPAFLGSDTPYMACFQLKSGANIEDNYSKLAQDGYPVMTWPDLPPEVGRDEKRFAIANKLRKTLIFFQSLRLCAFLNLLKHSYFKGVLSAWIGN